MVLPAVEGFLRCGVLDHGFARVRHRHLVFTIPRRLRLHFRYDRRLLAKLARAAYGVAEHAIRQATGQKDDRPVSVAVSP